MIWKIRWLAPVLAIALAACSQAPGDSASGVAAEDAVAVTEAGAPPEKPADGAAPVEVAVPRIAYVYRVGYRLSGDAIPALQQAHVALCDKAGASRCQVIGMQTSGGESDYASGTLKLRVASAQARAFIDQLNATAKQRTCRSRWSMPPPVSASANCSSHA